MSRRRAALVVDLLLLLAILSILLAACGPPENPGVFQEGRQARQLFNRLVSDARDFLAGFCGIAPVGMVLLGLSVAALRKRGA